MNDTSPSFCKKSPDLIYARYPTLSLFVPVRRKSIIILIGIRMMMDKG